MKRTRLTLTALTVATAMTLSATPAMAQDQDIPRPATIDVYGTTWYLNTAYDDESYYVQDPALIQSKDLNDDQKASSEWAWNNRTEASGSEESPAPAPAPAPATEEDPFPGLEGSNPPATVELGGTTWYLNRDGKTYVTDKHRVAEVPTQAEKDNSVEMVKNHPEIFTLKDNEQGSDNNNELIDGAPLPKTIDVNGTTWYLTNDGKYYVADSSRWNTELTVGEKQSSDEMLRKNRPDIYERIHQNDAEKPGNDDTDTNHGGGALGLLAGLALPAALLIGGTTWFLNHDGKTYVTDESRVDSEPTDAEKQTSQEMLEKNAEEVANQAKQGNSDAANGQQEGLGHAQAGANEGNSRGIAASTGNNTVPRALAALGILAMIAAAAVAVRRRFMA